MNGADHFTFKNLNINATGTTYGIAAYFYDGANHNTIDSCTLEVPANTTTFEHVPLVFTTTPTDYNSSAVSAGLACDSNAILNSIFENGRYTIYQRGKLGDSCIGNSFVNNQLKDATADAFFSYYSTHSLLQENEIWSPTRTNFIYYAKGIDVLPSCTHFTIEKNHLHDVRQLAPSNANIITGMDIKGSHHIIRNNLIESIKSNGSQYALIISSVNSLVAHNTIVLDDGNASTSFAEGIRNSGFTNQILNNNVTITRNTTGNKIGLYYINLPATSDNNNVFVSGTVNNYYGRNGFNHATIAAWQAATSLDANSLDADPQFLNPASADYTPGNAALNAGIPIASITDDINGAARSTTAPTMGAFEASCASPLAGTYTINNTLPASATNFTSFNAVRNKLCDCGISAPVIFNVAANQSYTEQVDFCEVVGASATNTITFNGNNATLTYGGQTATAPWTMRMDGADYFTFKNLNISATGATHAIAAYFYDAANHNTIDSCTLNVPANTTTLEHVPLVFTTQPTDYNNFAAGPGLACDSNAILNSIFENGRYTIYQRGKIGDSCTGNSFVNNQLKDAMQDAFNSKYSTHSLLQENEIWGPTRTNFSGYASGIYVLSACTHHTIEQNHIHDLRQLAPSNASIIYGILIVGNHHIIRNNLIESIKSNGVQYALDVNSDNSLVAHNTIVLDDSSASTSTASGITNFGSPNQILNNNIAITRNTTGNKIGLHYFNLPATSDNNNVFVSGAGNNYYGSNGSNQATLAAWQNATSLDANSLDVDPQFVNPAIDDYTPGNVALNAGIPIASITDDINGAARSTSAPTIGAFEAPCASPLAGTYTINNTLPASATNFIDFNSVRNKLCDCGISAPVLFNVAANQSFTEQVDFCEVVGASATNTITFNGNNATLTYGGGNAAAPWTMRMNGADHFTFKNLNISATGATHAIAAYFYDGANHNTIDSCTLNVPANSTNISQIPLISNSHPNSPNLVGAGAASDSNIVSNSVLENGYTCIWYANSTGTQIINNTLKDAYRNFLYLNGVSNCLISTNEMYSPSRTVFSTSNAMIRLFGGSNSTIEKNHLYDPVKLTSVPVSSIRGIMVIGGTNHIIQNNLIESIDCDGIQYGMDIWAGATNIKIRHNTIVLDDTNLSTSSTSGIYNRGTTAQIENNNIVISRKTSSDKYGLRYEGLPAISNYNNVYVSGLGNNFYGRDATFTSQSTLAAWKGSTNLDANSLDVDPQFVNPAMDDYNPSNLALNDKGTALGVLDDFENQLRSTTTPDIGAFEFGCGGNSPITTNFIATTDTTNCFGINDGQVNIQASLGLNPYTYTLQQTNSSNSTGIFSGLAGGAYDIFIVDAQGCEDTVSFNVLQNSSAVNISNIMTNDPNCSPGNNGSINITATGGAANYQYDIGSGPQGNGSFINLGAATYNIAVTDTYGCSATSTVQLTAPSAPAITSVLATNVSCNGNPNGSISVNATGTGTINYNLTPGNLNNNTGQFIGLGANNYTISVSDAAGCSVSTFINISQPTAVSITNSSANNVSCNGQADGSLNIAATGGTGTINYNLMPGNITNGTGAFTNLGPNNYTISATDANGCIATTIVNIAQPTAVSITNTSANNVSCNGLADGSLNIAATGGTGTINYNLMPGNITNGTGAFTNLGPNSYTISATDANGCIATTIVNIAQPTAVSITNTSANNVSCNGLADGSLNIAATGGTGTINYNLMPGNITNGTGAFTNLGPNSYTISATDANGCIATTIVNIAQPTAVSITNTSANNVSCNGQADGSLNIAATGGTGTINYNLMPGNITNGTGAFTNLGPNSYTISATDANGCSASTVVVISEPALLTLNLMSSTNVLCNGASTASIQVNANGGNGSNTFLLNPLAISNNTGLFNNLGAQVYSISVTDINGCTSAITTNITEPTTIMANIVVDSVNCNGDASGNIQINTSGGTSPYNYLLQPGAVYNTSGIFPNLSAGIYSASITDANGCSYQSQSITVDEPTAISFASINITDIDCYGFLTGAINAKASGGTGNISYAIFPNVGTQNSPGNFSQLSAGNYSIVATDANGCSFSTMVSVTQNAEIIISNIMATEPICSYDQNGSLAITASGGSGAFQYSLNNGNFNANSTKNNLALGNYFIQIKDALGCIIDSTIELNGPAPVQLSSFDLVHTTCKNTNDGKINAVAIGGRGNTYAYSLNPGAFTNQNGQFNGLAVGNYTLQISDSAQCIWDTTVRVRLLNPLRLEITKQDLPCIGRGDEGEATVIPTGGLAPYTYLWNSTPTQTSDKATLLRAGKYSVEVQDANGCVKRANTTILAGDCCGEIFIPTAFSPNGDGNNDVFRISTTTGLDVFQLQVFNRWGEVVWGGNAITDGWNGTFKGEPASMDTYYYTLSYLCSEDKKFYKKNGSVTLIR